MMLPSQLKQATGPVKIGKRIVPVKHERDQWDYLRNRNEDQWKVEQGTRGTRFHNGFNRRQQGDIGQDADRKAYESQRASRASSVQERRRERLTKLGKYNGFNVVTGQDYGASQPSRRQKRHFGSEQSEFLKREGDVLLRTSASRFHRPERVTTHKRTSRIKTEGLVTTVKHSSVLGIGRAEIKSHGVSDNFSHSLWAARAAAESGASPTSSRSVLANAARASVSAGGRSARSTHSIRSKPPRDPDLVPQTNGGGGGGGGAASVTGGSVRSSHSFGAGGGSVRSIRSARSRASAVSVAERRRTADIEFVKALPD